MGTLSLRTPSTRVLDKKPADARAHINKQRQAKYDKAQLWLSGEYPAVFSPFMPLPLAIGVGKTIIAAMPADTSGKTMVRTIARWTRKPAYVDAIATGDLRYHLDGSPADSISD